MKHRAACLLGLLLAATSVFAVDNLPPLQNPVLQQRYLALTHELRCMQCQNESLADSPVSLAADLRREVQTLLLQGDSDDQIRDHMVARYGEFILFRPRMVWRNAWLWGAPLVFMLIGAVVAVRILRARRALVDDDTADLADPTSQP